MERHFLQDLQYQKNEYFSVNGVKNNFSVADNIRIGELVNSIDSIITFLTRDNQKQTQNKFSNLANPYITELRKIFDERSIGNDQLNNALRSVLDGAVSYVLKYIDILTDNSDYHPPLNNQNLEEKIALMKEQGYLEFEFDESDEFLNWSNEQLDSARKKYEGQADWRGANSYDADSGEFQLINRFIEKNNILPIISSYKKMEMSVIYAAWDYSHKRQQWFRNNHEYNHLSPTNYYHFDADADVAKMLIYLTDVSEGDGAFKVVKGSNNMSRSIFLTYIFYAFDTILSPSFSEKGNLYGRGVFLYGKDLLMQFPYCLIGTTHFGDDLIEESSLANYLLENTITFTRKKGTVVLFDGFRGIHAGGNAFEGERLAVQVAFRRNKSISGSASGIDRMKAYIKQLINK